MTTVFPLPGAAPRPRPSAFPSGARYVEALQNTDMCFADPRLRGARVQLDRLGMPRPISGNFASVFSLTDPAGRRHAVKCFTQNVADQQKRYTEISRRLGLLGAEQLSQPWKMEFEYLDSGILVDGFRWPVLKMAWMDGVGLMRWLDENHHRPEMVEQLSDRFLRLVADLESAGVAHGDLQHGNLLVAPDNTLRLVDYDGMYVESLAGLPAAEDGHRHYQSPRRGAGDFGPTMDRFSAWLIYLSLQALVHDPGLWSRLHDPQGEFLLLEQSDLTLPQSSPRLSALETSSALGRVAADQIRQLTASPLAGVPKLAPVSPAMLAQAAALSASAAGTPAGSVSGSAYPASTGTSTLPSWLIDHVAADPGRIPQIEVAPFSALRFFDFFCFLLTVATCVLAVVLGKMGDLTQVEEILVGCCSVLWLELGRGTRAEIKAMREYRRTYARLRRHNAEEETRLSAYDHEVAVLTGERSRQRALLTAERKKLSARRAAELNAVDRECASQLASTNGQLSALDVKLTQQLQQELAVIRQVYAVTELAKIRTEAMVRQLPDLGRGAADKLIAAGIHSAADFAGIRVVNSGTYSSKGVLFLLRNGREVRVASIGERRAMALENWRRQMEAYVLRDAPTALPPAREALLRRVQHEQREFWKAGRTLAESEARRRREAVNLDIARTDAKLSNQLNALTLAETQAGRQYDSRRRPVELGLTESRAVADAYWTGLQCAGRLSFRRYVLFLLFGR